MKTLSSLGLKKETLRTNNQKALEVPTKVSNAFSNFEGLL